MDMLGDSALRTALLASASRPCRGDPRVGASPRCATVDACDRSESRALNGLVAGSRGRAAHDLPQDKTTTYWVAVRDRSTTSWGGRRSARATLESRASDQVPLSHSLHIHQGECAPEQTCTGHYERPRTTVIMVRRFTPGRDSDRAEHRTSPAQLRHLCPGSADALPTSRPPGVALVLAKE